MFCLLIVSVMLSVLAKLLARKTPRGRLPWRGDRLHKAKAKQCSWLS